MNTLVNHPNGGVFAFFKGDFPENFLNLRALYAMITISIQVFLFLRRSPVLLWDVSKTLCLTITFLMHKSREFIRRCSLVQIIYMYRRIMDERKKKI